MLSQADVKVCERDLALPGLRVILDSSALAAAINCPDLTSAYLRYKPGVSCTAAFLHPQAGALAAYAYPSDRYADVKLKLEAANEVAAQFLDASCIIVLPAQLDHDLRALRRLLDPDRRPKYLRRVTGGRERLCNGDLTLLRYKPGRRLVARVDRNGVPIAALKVTGKQDFNNALIGATGAAAHGGAKLLGANSEFCALITSWMAGSAVCPEMLGYAPDKAILADVGAALARLHADPFRPAAQILPADDGDVLMAVAEDLNALDARLSSDALRIGSQIAAQVKVKHYLPTLVHGDFSADQVVITPDHPVIIDWDNAACGDPARDLGTFLARMDAQVVDGVLKRFEADVLGGALIEGYASVANSVPSNMNLHHARALLLLISEGFRTRRLDWTDRGHALLERASDLMDKTLSIGRDPAMPELDVALSRTKVLSAFNEALGTHAPQLANYVQPELVRHKPGRRALIRYRTDGDNVRNLLGKVRAKGLDHRTPDIYSALRKSGLDGCAASGAGVPSVVGRIKTMKMWLQEEVSGDSLACFLGTDNVARFDAFLRTGAALAALHQAPPATNRTWTHSKELDVLDRALESAAPKMPNATNALRSIGQGARTRLQRLGDADVCGIHRDFYFDQLLIDRAQIWLVDLDLYAIGDPAIDVGNFLAHLDEYGLRNSGKVTAFVAEEDAFLNGYATVRPLPSPERVGLLRSISLARHIYISTLFDARRHITQELISISLAALSADDGEKS